MIQALHEHDPLAEAWTVSRQNDSSTVEAVAEVLRDLGYHIFMDGPSHQSFMAVRTQMSVDLCQEVLEAGRLKEGIQGTFKIWELEFPPLCTR